MTSYNNYLHYEKETVYTPQQPSHTMCFLDPSLLCDVIQCYHTLSFYNTEITLGYLSKVFVKPTTTLSVYLVEVVCAFLP